MKYLLKQSFIPIVYLFFMAMISIGIISIGNDLVWLKLILSILNIGLYCFLVGTIAFKEGENALKVRIANDIERIQIIKTGEERPLKLQEEYKPWKGFMVGLITCVPLIVMMIVHTILYFAAGPQFNGGGVVASFMYMMFASLVKLDSSLPLQQWHYYFNLIAVPVIMITTGLPYILGAKKIQHQQDMIKEKQRQIYGDDYDK